MVFTENRPPYNYANNGKNSGFSTEALQETLKIAVVEYTIRLAQWNGAYHRALKMPNSLIYTLARTTERESQFHWISPLDPRKVRLYKLAKRTDIKVANLEAVKSYANRDK